MLARSLISLRPALSQRNIFRHQTLKQNVLTLLAQKTSPNYKRIPFCSSTSHKPKAKSFELPDEELQVFSCNHRVAVLGFSVVALAQFGTWSTFFLSSENAEFLSSNPATKSAIIGCAVVSVAALCFVKYVASRFVFSLSFLPATATEPRMAKIVTHGMFTVRRPITVPLNLLHFPAQNDDRWMSLKSQKYTRFSYILDCKKGKFLEGHDRDSFRNVVQAWTGQKQQD